MPRHPPNALTSRLRIHTINDSLAWAALSLDVDDNLSQITTSVSDTSAHITQSLAALCAANQCTTASIKNPFTMSKKQQSQKLRITGSSEPDIVSSSLESFLVGASPPTHAANDKDGGAYRDRTDDPLLAKQVLSQLS